MPPAPARPPRSTAAVTTAWGNVTSRTYSGTTATLTYDLLDHFLSWNAGSATRALRLRRLGQPCPAAHDQRSGTTRRCYAFGLEEHAYSATWQRAPRPVLLLPGGRLLGTLDSSSQHLFYLTDALGSVLASFSNVTSTAASRATRCLDPTATSAITRGRSTPPRASPGSTTTA